MIMLAVVLPILVGLPILGVVLGILTAVDVAKYPEWAFSQTGATKTVWQVLPVVLGLFCLGIGGIVMYAMWTSSKRDLVARAARAGPPAYGYGAPQPPGYGVPPGGYGPPPAPGWAPPTAPGAPPPPAPGPPPAAPQSPPATSPPPGSQQ